MYDFLSGNVPGGLGLYVLLVLVLFLALHSASRSNELFTPRLFRRWFGAIWAVITGGYLLLWFGNPPPAVYSRYSTMFSVEQPGDAWLAYYFRDEVSRQLKPGTSATHYFFPERWNDRAGIDCVQDDEARCDTLARSIPLNQVLRGRLLHEDEQIVLVLSLMEFPAGHTRAERSFEISPGNPQQNLPDIIRWVGDHFPLREQPQRPEPARKAFVLARNAFYRSDYAESLRLLQPLLQDEPATEAYRKWYFYNRIRQAAARKAEQPADPHRVTKTEWQLTLDEARKFLLGLAKTNFEQDALDPLLNNMIAESFIIDEYFDDAEEFLRIAFGEDPYSMEVLENMTLLHESRYHGLPFKDKMSLYQRILNICPLNERILEEYVDKLLLNVQVTDAQSKEIQERIHRLLAIHPASVTALSLLGKFHSLNFDYDQALEAFRKADSLQPGRAQTQYNLGVTYYQLKDLDRAEQYFQNAVKLDDYLEAHLYLGAIYKERGEYEKALAQFRYRVARKQGDDDYYAVQAMKGIRECLEALNIEIPNQ